MMWLTVFMNEILTKVSEVTGAGAYDSKSLTRRLTHWMCRQVTGKSFTAIARQTGQHDYIARADYINVSSYDNQPVWEWVKRVEDWVIGKSDVKPETVWDFPERTYPPELACLVTDWLPDTMDQWDSQYGRVTNRQWVLKESDRICGSHKIKQFHPVTCLNYVALAKWGMGDLKDSGCYPIDQ
jgi:hypothetical protein